MDADTIIKLQEKLDADKGTIKSVFDELRLYVTPNEKSIIDEKSPGQKNSSRRYDSTAVHANKLLASRIQAAIFPSTSKPFGFKFRNDDLNDLNEVQDWIDDTTDRMFAAYNSSNFHTSLHECFLDLGGYGTTNIIQLEKPKGIHGTFSGLDFKRWPIGDYVFWEGADGKADGVIRRWKVTAYEIRQKFEHMPGFKGFGKSIDAALSDPDVKKQSDKFDIIHCIYQNPTPHGLLAHNKSYRSLYINVKDKHVIRESGFNEFPCAIGRWDRSDDDNGWGRGPGWVALSEIRTVNRVRELALKNLAKQVSPPIVVPHKGVIGGIQTLPNGINVVRPDADIRYLETRGNADIVGLEVERLQNQINQIFFIDRLQLPDKPDMTATEAQIRYQQMLQLLGSTFFRITDELLNPIITRTFNIMLNAGAFLPLPESLKSAYANGNELAYDIDYFGPLARIQKQEEVHAIESTYQRAAMIAQMRQDSSILDNLDDDEALKVIAEQTGLPAKILRGKDEVAQSRQDRAAIHEQQAQLDQAQQVTGIVQQADAIGK